MLTVVVFEFIDFLSKYLLNADNGQRLAYDDEQDGKSP